MQIGERQQGEMKKLGGDEDEGGSAGAEGKAACERAVAFSYFGGAAALKIVPLVFARISGNPVSGLVGLPKRPTWNCHVAGPRRWDRLVRLYREVALRTIPKNMPARSNLLPESLLVAPLGNLLLMVGDSTSVMNSLIECPGWHGRRRQR